MCPPLILDKFDYMEKLSYNTFQGGTQKRTVDKIEWEAERRFIILIGLRSDTWTKQRMKTMNNTKVGEIRQQKLRNKGRSEEHTSELQSRGHLVCRLLLEKKKNTQS